MAKIKTIAFRFWVTFRQPYANYSLTPPSSLHAASFSLTFRVRYLNEINYGKCNSKSRKNHVWESILHAFLLHTQGYIISPNILELAFSGNPKPRLAVIKIQFCSVFVKFLKIVFLSQLSWFWISRKIETHGQWTKQFRYRTKILKRSPQGLLF